MPRVRADSDGVNWLPAFRSLSFELQGPCSTFASWRARIRHTQVHAHAAAKAAGAAVAALGRPRGQAPLLDLFFGDGKPPEPEGQACELLAALSSVLAAAFAEDGTREGVLRAMRDLTASVLAEFGALKRRRLGQRRIPEEDSDDPA